MKLKGSLINVVFRAIHSKNKELFSFNMNGEVKLNGELIHKYNLTKPLNQNKMTAISSLIQHLLPFVDRSKISDVALHNIVEEHIEMEKEQIVDAWCDGAQPDKLNTDFAEQYYFETYETN